MGGTVRTFRLAGLGVDETRALLAPKHLEGSSTEWAEFAGQSAAMVWRTCALCLVCS
jgi:hypothetical protein